jgi:NAD-dependent SIR2 family protein deacetylase
MHSLDQGIAALGRFFEDHQHVVALTGAGISADSGIPTYRDGQGRWLHSEPIKHQEFISSPLKRKRYWARSMRGWPAVRDAAPNRAHRALAALEQAGHISAVITQNVDRLHQQAGSERVIDLHGRLDRVQCLDCAAYQSRERVQARLLRLNPDTLHTATTAARPDGDADLPDTLVERVTAPSCTSCGGVLMPDVVFFGGTVPRERVHTCMHALDQADALLAVGSSLQVFSGFRFCRRAAESGKPIAIINPGVTRADELAGLRLRADCGDLLSGLTRRWRLASSPGSPS